MNNINVEFGLVSQCLFLFGCHENKARREQDRPLCIATDVAYHVLRSDKMDILMMMMMMF